MGTEGSRSATASVTELAERVHSLAIHLLRRVRAADVESELSAARLSALSVIVYTGPLSVGRLAAAEQVTAATTSRLVTRLERDGLVERVPHPGDRRRVRVRATGAGRRALREARERRVERMAELLSAVEPARRQAVVEAVVILEGALEEAASREGT